MFIDFKRFRATVQRYSSMFTKETQKSTVFFDFSNHARAQVPIFTPNMKNKIATAGEPADPPDPWHGAWCTTPGTLAPEVRMTVVLNKLLQTMLRQQESLSWDWFPSSHPKAVNAWTATSMNAQSFIQHVCLVRAHGPMTSFLLFTQLVHNLLLPLSGASNRTTW